MNTRFRMIAAASAVALAAAVGMSSAGSQAGPAHVLAQATPDESASPMETAAPQRSPVPVQTPVPGVPTPDANGVTPVNQGGTTGNSNGSNWLEKFNRKPGADTGESNAQLDVKIRNGPVKKAKVKRKSMKTKPPM